MKKYLHALLAAAIAAAVALGIAACGGGGADEGGSVPAAATIADSDAATIADPEATTTADAEDTDGNDNADQSAPQLLTSPPGEARIWRSFTAAGLNLTNMNPHTTSNSTDADAINWTSSGFVRRDQRSTDWEFIPETAREMPTSNENGTVWTIRLREDLAWTNGTPVNAHDYEYAYRMLLNPRLANRNAAGWWGAAVQVVNARAYFLGDEAPNFDLPIVTWEDVGFRVIDDYTIEFTFEVRPLPLDLLNWFADGTWAPVYIEEYEAGMNEDRTETSYRSDPSLFTQHHVFGPYRVYEIIPDMFYSFRRNDDWINAHMWGREIISARNIAQLSTREQMFLDGHLDTIVVTADNFDTWSQDPRTRPGAGGTMWGLFVNTISQEFPALADRDFRHALSYATDRELLNFAVFRVFTPASGLISANAIIGNPLEGNTMQYRASEWGQGVFPPNYGFNPARAIELFDQVYERLGGQRIDIQLGYFEGQDTSRRSAEVLQEMWMATFGADRLNVELFGAPPSAHYDSAEGPQPTHGMFIGAFGQSPTNPWSSMMVYTTEFTNSPTTWDRSDAGALYVEEFTELWRRSTSGDLLHADTAARASVLARMESIFLDYMPFIPLYQNSNWSVFSERTHLLYPDFIPGGLGFLIDTVDPMPWAGAPILDYED